MKTLGEIIKNYRNEHDLSLRQFADLSGVSHSYIDKLEKGMDPRTGKPVEPTLDSIEKIASAMNISLDGLLKLIGKIDNKLVDNLTPKDMKSIEKDLNKMMEDMENNPDQGFAAYNGENIDETDIELFKNALRDALILAKKINKKKYTPKKYRKDDK